jgi:hypothetical protein
MSNKSQYQKINIENDFGHFEIVFWSFISKTKVTIDRYLIISNYYFCRAQNQNKNERVFCKNILRKYSWSMGHRLSDCTGFSYHFQLALLDFNPNCDEAYGKDQNQAG